MTDLHKAASNVLKDLELFDASANQHGCAWQKHHIASLREALAAPVVPPGYALVPLEPTPEMRSAGFMVDKGPTIHHACADAYRAMLAAAPKPKEQTT